MQCARALAVCVKALLHAISKGLLDIVRVIIDHPNYLSEEMRVKRSTVDATVHAEEKYQYSPDITPLMLAAHMCVIIVFFCLFIKKRTEYVWTGHGTDWEIWNVSAICLSIYSM